MKLNPVLASNKEPFDSTLECLKSNPFGRELFRSRLTSLNEINSF